MPVDSDRERNASRKLRDSGVVDDVRGIRRSRDLEAERRHRLVGACPRKRRRGAVDRRGRERSARHRHRPLLAELVHECSERNVRHAAVGKRLDAAYLVLGRDEIGDGHAELLGIVHEPPPVEIELVVRDYIGLGHVGAVVEHVRLRHECAHGNSLEPDSSLAVDSDTADGDLGRKPAAFTTALAAVFTTAGRNRRNAACRSVDDNAVA